MKKFFILSLSFFILSCSTLFSAPKNGTRTLELDGITTAEMKLKMVLQYGN